MKTPTAIVIAGALIAVAILGLGFFKDNNETAPGAASVSYSTDAETEARKTRQRESIAKCLQDDMTASESICLKKANAAEEKRRLAEKYDLDTQED